MMHFGLLFVVFYIAVRFTRVLAYVLEFFQETLLQCLIRFFVVRLWTKTEIIGVYFDLTVNDVFGNTRYNIATEWYMY